jgi:YVTN family beta-propeller protein
VITTIPVEDGPFGVVSVIDAATDTVVALVSTGCASFGVAVHPTAALLYVTNLVCGTLSIIDTTTNTLLTSVVLGNPPGRFEPPTLGGVSVHPSGTHVYVPRRRDNTVAVIDTKTNAVITNVLVGTLPIGFGQFVVTVRPELHVSTFSPTHGGNAGTVTVTIRGGGFNSHTEARLIEGDTVIVNGQNTLVRSTSRLRTTFDLRGQAPRRLTVAVVNPTGDSTVAAEPFTIVEGGSPDVTIRKVGTQAVPGRTVEYFIVVGKWRQH